MRPEYFIKSSFRQAIDYIHNLLSYFIGRLHGRSFRVNTDDRFGITFAQMNPFVRKINLHTVNVISSSL